LAAGDCRSRVGICAKSQWMSLSLSTGYHYRLYYETDASPFSFVLFYFAVFLADILMVMLIVLMRLVMVHS
jgi:hypothetical protein